MNPLSLSEKEVTEILDQTRLDPRLMEVITEYLRDFWWVLDAKSLHKHAKKMKHAFSLKVATTLILDHCEMDQNQRADFIHWMQEATKSIPNPKPQLYYVSQYPAASRMTWLDLEESLLSFRKVNTYCKDLPFNKGQPGTLKSPTGERPHQASALDLLKLNLARKLKVLKKEQQLSNQQLIQQTGINTVFLSNILNNKLEKISAEYLQEKLGHLV